MLDALALEILDKGPKRRSSRLVSANPPGLYGQALKAFRIEDMSMPSVGSDLPVPAYASVTQAPLILKRASRLSCGKPRESRVFTPIRESSGESRLHKPARET
jgi:hypothetical protein